MFIQADTIKKLTRARTRAGHVVSVYNSIVAVTRRLVHMTSTAIVYRSATDGCAVARGIASVGSLAWVDTVAAEVCID